MNKHSNIFQSFRSSVKGFRHGSTGRNLRVMVFCFALALFLAWYYPLTATQRYLVIILGALIIGAELINSAVEELCDVLIQEHHPGIAKVKEMAAAGVFLMSLAAAIVGISIFWQYL